MKHIYGRYIDIDENGKKRRDKKFRYREESKENLKVNNQVVFVDVLTNGKWVLRGGVVSWNDDNNGEFIVLSGRKWDSLHKEESYED